METNLLRMARIQAGFTQENLAERLDVSCMTIYRWESGQRTPDQEKRMQICTILGKKAEELGWSEGEEKLTIARGARLLDPLIPLKGSVLIGQQIVLQALQTQCFKLRTTGLIGLPGCGKTAVAVALAATLSHQFAGVLWASVGQRSNPRRHFQRWANLLGIEKIPEDLAEAREVLQTAVGGRRFLIVLDDLWSASDWSIYHVGGQCHYLLTTRQVSLAYQICESVYRPQQLTPAQAMHLLSRGLPPLYRHKHRLALQRIAEQWNLPLAMEHAATYLCHEASTDSPRRIQDAIGQLSSPEFILHLSSCSSEQRVAAAIQQSERWLPEPAQRALSCLATHFPVAPATFSETHAAGVLDQYHLKIQALDLVADAGLVEACGKGEYQLHPVIVAYARFGMSTAENVP